VLKEIGTLQDLQRIWSRLEKEARGVNGEVKLHSA
jgi:hypothetical protein